MIFARLRVLKRATKMRVETKQSIRDDLLSDLASLMDNLNFCSEMYEETRKLEYLNLADVINAKIIKRKRQLKDLVAGYYEF